MTYKVVRVLPNGQEIDVTAYQDMSKCQSDCQKFMQRYKPNKYKIVEAKK